VCVGLADRQTEKRRQSNMRGWKQGQHFEALQREIEQLKRELKIEQDKTKHYFVEDDRYSWRYSYIYVCMYLYICICIYTDMYMSVCIYMYVYVFTYI